MVVKASAASNVLTLREHQSAQLGDRWSVEDRVIDRRDAPMLEAINARQNANIFALGYRNVKATQFVGTMGVGRHLIEVLPKIDRDLAATRKRLVEMLSISGLMRFYESSIAAQASDATTVLDAFMKVYIKHLAIEWRRGRIMNYRKTEGNRTSLKGKLLFADQLRRNVFHPERFYTRCDQFTSNVLPSQLLKAGLHVCRRRSSQHAIRQDAIALLDEFEEVSNVSFDKTRLDSVQSDRRAERYDPLLLLAKQLVSSETPDRPGAIETFSLLFDMNVVFERYISALICRKMSLTNCSATYQVKGRHLLHRDSQKKFGLRPDVGIYEEGALSCLIDTKWKQLDRSKSHEGVSQADMYQMYAYAKEYKCPRVVLLYPRHGDFARRVASYHLAPVGHDSPRIEVCTVDVSRPASEVARELEGLVSEITGATSRRM